MEKGMRKWIVFPLVFVLLLLPLTIPDRGTVYANSSYRASVTSYTLTLRSRPSIHYRTLRMLTMANQVTVLGKSGGYSHVRYGKTTGYVQSPYLSRTPFHSYSAYVTSSTLIIRSRAGIHYTRVARLTRGNQVTVIGKGSTYTLVKSGKKQGFVQGKYLSKAKPVIKQKAAAKAKPVTKAKPVVQTKPAAKSKPVAKAKPAAKSKPVAKAKPAFQTVKAAARAKPVTKAKPMVQIKPAAKSKPATATKSAAAAKSTSATQTLTTAQQRNNPPVQPGSQFGIDVSHYQNKQGTKVYPIDFRSVKQSGNSFVIIKATDGNNTDGYFEQNAQNAAKAGLSADAYHFLEGKTTQAVQAEAKHFVSELKNVSAKDHLSFQYVFVDVEPTKTNGFSTLSKTVLTANVEAFLAQLRASGFNKLGIYSNLNFFNANMNLPQIIQSQSKLPAVSLELLIRIFHIL